MVLFSVLLENSGLLKAGPRPAAEFEPASGKTYKFSDVHGVDEAKDVSTYSSRASHVI
jgi:ATP-dependent metalloprotease